MRVMTAKEHNNIADIRERILRAVVAKRKQSSTHKKEKPIERQLKSANKYQFA